MIINSDGTFGHYRSSDHSLSCIVIAQEKSSMERDYWYTSARDFRELERDLHRDYKNCRIPQTEYFRLNEIQILEVSKKFKLWAK